MAWHASLYDGKLGATAQDDRQLVEAAIAGVGVIDIGDLLVSAGSGLNSSIAAGRASIRNTFATTQGGLYLARNDAAVSYAHPAADLTNPRIDQVLAKVYDSETGGDASDVLSGVVVPGTANAGGAASAMLDSRAGAASLAAFNNYILIADVYVPANAASAAAFTYRDRRPLATSVAPPSVKSSLIGMSMAPYVGLQNGLSSQIFANYQVAMSTYLPRRISSATKIRWLYGQGSSSPATGNYNIGIYDASGRLIVSTGAVAFTGAANTIQQRSETISTTTFEAGMYYVCLGSGTPSTLNIVYQGSIAPQVAPGGSVSSMFVPNAFLYSLTGGTALPTTLNSFLDIFALSALVNWVPSVALSQA